MSLRSKILLILALVVSVFSIGDNLVQRSVVGGSIQELQSREAQKDLQRVIQALEAEKALLEQRARDWAETDEVRETCLGERDPSEFGESQALVLEERGLDLVYVCGDDGTVLWGRVEDPGTRETISLREMPGGKLDQRHPLLKRTEGRDSISGLLMTSHGAMLLGSHAVRYGITGLKTGTVVLGRFVSRGMLDELGQRELVTFNVSPVEAPSFPPGKEHLVDRITTAAGPVQDQAEDGTLQIYTTVRDLLEAPSILVRADIVPEITNRGTRSVNYALLSTIGSGLLIMFVLVRLLTKIVIGPLTTLTKAATEIGRTDDTSLRVGIEREDEIGELSAEFDSMLEKLEVSKREVIRTSRLAGMSEIATGVLHNVGNVLNSVNVSANLVTRKAEQLPIEDFLAMRDILKTHEADLAAFIANDPQGQHLLPFLDELADSLRAGREAVLAELEGMNRGVEHIGELVRSQQSLAGRQGVLEPTDLRKLIESALVICQQAGKGKDVKVVEELSDLGPRMADRHKLMEIVVNLIKNAMDAMEDSGSKRKRLHLGLEELDGERVRITVKDTGRGIAPENLTKIFNHGFTTSKNGHGFGLHVSANAATEMKGSLTAESEGPGQGASFVLTIPAKEARVAQAA